MKAVSSIVLLAAAAALAGCGPAQPEMTVQQLMAKRVQPTAEIYWGAVSQSSELVGDKVVETSTAPQTDAEWQKVADAAVELGKLGQLLQEPGYTEGRNPDWKTFAQGLVDISRQAEAAAKARDPDKVFEVGGTIYSVCSACHLIYPATTGAEASEAAAAAS